MGTTGIFPVFFFSLYWHSVIHFPTIRRRIDCVIQFSLVCRFSVFFSFTLLFQLICFRNFSYLSNLISRNSWACRFWSIFSFVFTCVFVLFHRWKIFGINAALMETDSFDFPCIIDLMLAILQQWISFYVFSFFSCYLLVGSEYLVFSLCEYHHGANIVCWTVLWRFPQTVAGYIN